MGLIEGATRAALVGAVLAAIGTGATAARADDPVAAALPSFASPPAADRSGNWSGSSADAAGASTLLDALKQAGFGSAQLSYTPTAAGRAALTQVLEHAAQLGIDVNLAPCGNTSCDSSAVTLVTGMQELVTRNQAVTAPADNTAYSAAIPAAAMPGSPTLVAVTAAKVVSGTTLDPATAVDLTAKVSAGKLTWTIPTAGTWQVFAFYQRATGQYVNQNPFETPAVWTARDPSIGAASGHLIADIFSSQGLTDSLDVMANSVFSDGNLARLQGSSLFHDSNEVQAQAFWTVDLPAQFAARRGYAMLKYLPALDDVSASSFQPLDPSAAVPVPAPPFDFAGGVGARFRYDYHRTLNDLYVDRYVKAMNDWAHRNGLRSRHQVAYNYPALDVIRAATKTDIPESEDFDFAWGEHAFQNTLPTFPSDRWRYVVDSHKLMSSGAHIAGHDRVTEEWGEDFATYSKGPLEQADLVNDAVAGGVTQPIFAAGVRVDDSVYPLPGGLSFIGIDGEMTTNAPQWKDFGALTGYLARTTQVVEQGDPRVDVTVYHDGGLSSLHDGDVPLWRGRELGRQGYTYDFVDPVDLAGDAADRTPGRLFGDYRALILDNQTALPVDAAEAIHRYAAEGLPVVIVGAAPSQATGLNQSDSLVRDALAGIGVRVASEDAVPAALASLGVQPGARFSGAELQSVERRTASDDVWWLYNPSDAPVTTTGSFATTGRPYRLDLWNGSSAPVAQYAVSADRTDLPLTVPAHGTVAYLFHRGADALHVTATSAQHASLESDGSVVVEDARGGAQTVSLSDGRGLTADLGSVPAPLTVSGWQLDVDEIAPSGHTYHHLDLPALKDWRSIPELADAVGSATYTAAVDVPAGWTGRGVRLDLGAFPAAAVRPYINGTLVTGQTTPGGDVTVGALLHLGTNRLVIKLDTTLNNRNAQLASTGNLAYATGPTPLGPLPSGLLGPVTLTPTGVAVIPASQTVPAPAPPVVAVPQPAGAKPISAPSVSRVAVRVTRSGKAVLRLSCPATSGATCRGRIQLAFGHTIIGARNFAIAAGRPTAVSVTLTKAARKQLRRRHHETITASVSAVGSDGVTRLTAVRLTLRA